MKRPSKRLRIINLALFSLLMILFSTQLTSQELYVGSGAEFFMKTGTDFTTSNTIVFVDPSGIFSIEAGNTWGSAQEYVNGSVSAYGSGQTKLPVGNNTIYAPVTADHSGTLTGSYFNSAPFTGSLGTNVDARSDIEYWELTGNATITLPWSSHSDMATLVNNNGGSFNSIAIVGLNGSTWDLVSAPHSNVVTGNLTQGTVTSNSANKVNLNAFSQFTFGIDHQVVLGVDDMLLNKDIVLLSNPVPLHSDILFRASNISDKLNVTIYDMNGRVLKQYAAMQLNGGTGNLPTANLVSGMYIIKFEHEGKTGVKKVIIE